MTKCTRSAVRDNTTTPYRTLVPDARFVSDRTIAERTLIGQLRLTLVTAGALAGDPGVTPREGGGCGLRKCGVGSAGPPPPLHAVPRGGRLRQQGGQ
eukprot:1611991-Pyramimonas_sp.AAC.1